ncbi:hypothetical protein NRA21_17920, partial [Acinetobacter baumannii]|nr:hypothetical protein [Acinetobacter baumannii]
MQLVVSSSPGAMPIGVTRTLVGVLYAAAVLVFAIGLTRESSVVARRPLGLVALAILAGWPFVDWFLTDVVMPYDRAPEAAGALGYIDLIVRIGAGLVAAVQIIRVGVVR